MDDIVIKSAKIEEHMKYLKKVFNMLRKFEEKLNLENCVFGVSVGIPKRNRS